LQGIFEDSIKKEFHPIIQRVRLFYFLNQSTARKRSKTAILLHVGGSSKERRLSSDAPGVKGQRVLNDECSWFREQIRSMQGNHQAVLSFL
jgi:hypothetical protein